jgi:hypothetical protein
LFAECEGYKDIGYLFSFLAEFGCLLDLESKAEPEEYCIGYVGTCVNAFNVNHTVSEELCHVLAETGCCYQSFVDVELPAIALDIVGSDVIYFMRNISMSCSELGVPLSSEPCQGGATDVCQLPFDEIAYDCVNYALDFPNAIFAAMQDQDLNAALCSDKCFNSTVKLAQILVANRESRLLSLLTSSSVRLRCTNSIDMANVAEHTELC